MSEDTKNTDLKEEEKKDKDISSETVEKEKKETKTTKTKKVFKDSEKKDNFNLDEDVEDLLKEKKDDLGLEELPDDIKKKLEKKKAEREQKHKKVKKKKKKAVKKVSTGKAYVKATYNNTIVTLTDAQGNVISWASAGMAGFKGPKKSTPYAAQIITRIAVGKAKEEFGLKAVSVFVKGIGTGREAAIRSLNNNGLIVTSIKDVTPVPHNGCRKRKPRRV